MHRLSLQTILFLWSELEEAYHGANKFGGNVAEIYTYRVLGHSPSGHDESDILDALGALYEVLKLFADTRAAKVLINGRRLGRWMIEDTPDHRHRFHIEIRERTGGKGR